MEKQSSKRSGVGFLDLFLGLAAAGLLSYGLYYSFYITPLLRHTGLPWWSQKIFYLHLPVAWGALSGLLLVFIGSVAYIWTEKERWDTFAVASSEVCFVFSTAVLLTGPLWARPSWGHYWKWEDPRLMSFLALWLVLGSYFLLRSYGGKGNSIRTASAALGILGSFAVPLVYLSVKLWRSIHPMLSAKEIDSRVRIAVWICLFAFFFLFLLLFRVRRRLETQENELHRLKMQVQELEMDS